jgi:hypothetical protein
VPKPQGKIYLFTADPNTSYFIFYREEHHYSIGETEKRQKYCMDKK